jgi:glyoxylase-like metal-dependent hydrolase (beta-lactamase superfamily II)
MRKTSLSLFIAATLGAGAASAQVIVENDGLGLEVYTSSAYGYAVTSALVYGEDEVLLIDPQFLRTEAKNVVELIRKSGKPLTMIYSTHAHPDHFLGVEAIKAAFPEARFVALPEVRERMVTAWPGRRNFWYPTYGEELPGEEPILPEALSAPQLEFDGHVFPITAEQIGLDGAGNSFVHIPALDTVVTGDIVFNSHLRPPADTAPLYETLARIAALKPRFVVAGHQAQGADSDADVLQFIPEYIDAFHEERGKANTAEELIAAMKARFPGLGREDALEQAANTAFAPPAP